MTVIAISSPEFVEATRIWDYVKTFKTSTGRIRAVRDCLAELAHHRGWLCQTNNSESTRSAYLSFSGQHNGQPVIGDIRVSDHVAPGKWTGVFGLNKDGCIRANIRLGFGPKMIDQIARTLRVIPVRE